MTAARHVIGTTVEVSAYIGTVVIANYTSAQWPALRVGPLLVPAGTLFAGATFTLRDLLHEALHTRGIAAAIVTGTGLSWLLASPQIAVASTMAFATSELLDSIVYTRLRARSRLHAVMLSNVAGLLVDSVVFVPLAFGTLAAVPGQLVGKAAATAITIALLVALSARWRAGWS